MNFKQKLVYMVIGCLFTLAGYFFASLGGSVLQTTHAQQNEKEIIDKIVCKRIEVVDGFGTTQAVIQGSLIGGKITLHNTSGDEVTVMKPGIYSVYTAFEDEENNVQMLYINPGGITVCNLDGKAVVSLGMSLPGFSGYIDVNNEEGKDLVHIGAQEGRPNDGLINVYNHKGEWRSISKD